LRPRLRKDVVWGAVSLRDDASYWISRSGHIYGCRAPRFLPRPNLPNAISPAGQRLVTGDPWRSDMWRPPVVATRPDLSGAGQFVPVVIIREVLVVEQGSSGTRSASGLRTPPGTCSTRLPARLARCTALQTHATLATPLWQVATLKSGHPLSMPPESGSVALGGRQKWPPVSPMLSPGWRGYARIS